MKKRGVWEGLLVLLKMGFDAKYTSRCGERVGFIFENFDGGDSGTVRYNGKELKSLFCAVCGGAGVHVVMGLVM